MNVLFLIFSFNTGGIEKQLIEMANNMVGKGHHVYLCIINYRYEEALFKRINKNVKLIRLNRPENSRNKLKYMLELSSIVKENKIQIIHCQEPTGVVFSIAARLLNPGMRVIETVHDIGEAKLYSGLELRVADFFCREYIAISDAVRNEIISRGIRNERITVINNAVNTKEFCPSVGNCRFDIHGSQENAGRSFEKKLFIGNVARFYPEKKGQDILVKAIEILKIKYPGIHCSFAGGVYRGQEGNWGKLQKYINDNNLVDNITLLGNVEDIPGFLAQIGIFVLPSIYEGFGISLIEAMAMGIPCVASNIDGPREILKETPFGVLAEPGNATDLAEKIDYVISNYYSYDGDKMSRYIKNKYDIDKMVDKHLGLYKGLINA